MNVPALRFPEFEGVWKPSKLKNITRIYDGTHQTPNYVAKGVPFYSVEHVTANQFERTKFISEEVFEKENKRVKLERDDILMTRIGDIGTARLVDWDVSASFYVSLALIKADPTKFESGFLSAYFGSDYLSRELHRRTIHVAFPKKINLGEIGETALSLPTLPEQKKIAAFLGAVDAKIAALRDRVAGLDRYKRGLMQALFSQTLRFTSEDGSPFPDWEEKRLEELASNPSYGMNAAAVEYDGQHKYVRITDIDEETRTFSTDKLTSPSGLIEEKYRLRTGDIVFARTGASTGKSYLYNEKDGEMYFAGFLIRFRITHADPRLIFYQTLTQRFAKWVLIMSMRSGQPGINADEYSSFKILLPHPDEQAKIAEALSAIDAKIAAVAGQLERMQDFKKGLLQQMFV